MTIDMTKIEAMKEAMGEDFALLIPAALSDAENLVSSLPQAIQQGQIEEVQRFAHSLKSVSLNVGANRLSELALGLEQQAKGGSLDGADSAAQQMQTEFELVKSELAKIS